jgi:hypothetical protein
VLIFVLAYLPGGLVGLLQALREASRRVRKHDEPAIRTD